MSKKTAIATSHPALPAAVTEAIEEQQARVWRLRNLIESVRKSADSGDEVDDFGAAISGLQDYADAIQLALDVGTIAQRVRSIDEDDQDAAARAVVQAAITKARK